MFRELLAEEFTPYGKLSNDQLDKLESHYNLLTRWNERMNLTRIRELKEVVQLHYCESLFLGNALPTGSLRIVDVGSGGGFPGIPVAIFRPDCVVDLCESNQRKSVFLRDAARGLGNVGVKAQRADTLAPTYDWAVSRAVTPEEVIELRLAPNAALLLQETDARKFKGETIPIPWGAGRVLKLVKSET